MKKWLLMTLVVLVAALIDVAIGEVIDISDYTLDELLALNKSVDEAIFDRDRTNESILFPGYYVFGEDLNPGTYVFYCLEAYENNATIYIYATQEEYDGRKSTDVIYLGEKEYWQYDLESTYAIRVYDGTFSIMKR